MTKNKELIKSIRSRISNKKEVVKEVMQKTSSTTPKKEKQLQLTK